jgi:hypothetical protein
MWVLSVAADTVRVRTHGRADTIFAAELSELIAIDRDEFRQVLEVRSLYRT